ncbi:MAG: DUF1800 domain-containing protein [Caulobacteraceae bacterium]
MALDRDLAAAIAATRFGLGAKPGEIEAAGADPRGWLIAQIDAARGADQPQANPETSAQRLIQLRQLQEQRREAKQDGETFDPVKFALKTIRKDAGTDFLARIQLAAATDADFRERWALFWCNHFTVSAKNLQTAILAGPFEQEAIRPHVFGKFEDLLVASTTHPAMLLYLDQAQSIGPDTRAAAFLERKGKTPGLNENLAREVMELHTVGVGAGYTQADVTEFARVLTGWSIGGLREPDDVAGRFMFRANAHEPGVRTVMGKRYAEDGMAQGMAVLKDLAASPHTARHLSVEIASQFVADEPPPALVARLERTYLSTGGDLGQMARTLALAPEAWTPAAEKFKMPYEFLVSSWRAAGMVPNDLSGVVPVLTRMGQKPFSAPSPKGWPESAVAWCAPDAVIKRMEWSQALAARSLAGRDPLQLARTALGARLTPLVATAISRAETREEGMAIFLMSPEFQRR